MLRKFYEIFYEDENCYLGFELSSSIEVITAGETRSKQVFHGSSGAETINKLTVDDTMSYLKMGLGLA